MFLLFQESTSAGEKKAESVCHNCKELEKQLKEQVKSLEALQGDKETLQTGLRKAYDNINNSTLNETLTTSTSNAYDNLKNSSNTEDSTLDTTNTKSLQSEIDLLNNDNEDFLREINALKIKHQEAERKLDSYQADIEKLESKTE